MPAVIAVKPGPIPAAVPPAGRGHHGLVGRRADRVVEVRARGRGALAPGRGLVAGDDRARGPRVGRWAARGRIGPDPGRAVEARRRRQEARPVSSRSLGRLAYAEQPVDGTRLPYTRANRSWRCVDDTDSKHYTAILDETTVEPDWTSAEYMKRNDGLYEWVIVIAHNEKALRSHGSCIFFHVWNAEHGASHRVHGDGARHHRTAARLARPGGETGVRAGTARDLRVGARVLGVAVNGAVASRDTL